MQNHNSSGRTLSQRIIHWLAAFCVLAAAGLALYLINPPDWSDPYVRRYDAGIEFHKLLGLGGLVFAFVLAVLNSRRAPPPGGPFLRLATATVKVGLLMLTAIAAATGYAANSSFGGKLTIPGLGSLPSPFSYNEELGGILTSTHQWIAYGLLSFIALHLGAALFHHFVLKDDVLCAMLTGRGKEVQR